MTRWARLARLEAALFSPERLGRLSEEALCALYAKMCKPPRHPTALTLKAMSDAELLARAERGGGW